MATIWDVESGKIILDHRTSCAFASLSAGGKQIPLVRHILSRPRNRPSIELELVDVASGEVREQCKLPVTEDYSALRFTPDSKHLLGVGPTGLGIHVTDAGKVAFPVAGILPDQSAYPPPTVRHLPANSARPPPLPEANRCHHIAQSQFFQDDSRVC